MKAEPEAEAEPSTVKSSHKVFPRKKSSTYFMLTKTSPGVQGMLFK